VTPSHKLRIVPKVLHPHIKNHMEGDLLKCWRYSLIIIQYLERNSHIPHLLPDRILSKSVTILFFDLHGFIPYLGDCNPTLVSLPVIPLGNHRDDSIPILQKIRHPPHKYGLIINLVRHGIFSNFKRVVFLGQPISLKIPSRPSNQHKGIIPWCYDALSCYFHF
jgi:hypothetical protein